MRETILRTYPHEKMLIKILAFRVLLRLFLYSASFIQVDALNKLARVSATKIIAPAAASSELKLKLPSFGTTPPACKTNLPFFLVLIFVLNNKSAYTLVNTLFISNCTRSRGDPSLITILATSAHSLKNQSSKLS